MAYGQTAITEDLYAARDAAGGQIIDEALEVRPHDVDTDSPFVTFEKDGEAKRIDCTFVAGCDGYHGVCRTVIPDTVLRTFEVAYPFGWLGVMAEVPPLEEIAYVNHERGFALASMRNPMLSRYYIQCSLDDKVEDWPDDRFWEELKARYPKDMAARIVTGPSIEKSIAPLRSFVAEPMRHGRLFLAGDAAHIVPPTGAKGLNLAFSDVFYLSRALTAHFKNGSDGYLDRYSEMALRRIWNAERLSWHLTKLLHLFPDDDPFEIKCRWDELNYLAESEVAMSALAEQYAGLPFED
jgi:p-hydroxybenzoate 3-monooxygenase